MKSTDSRGIDDGNKGYRPHYPTIQELRQLATEENYGGGTGKADSREFFEKKYFEPLEMIFYETLRARYSEMTVENIVVCRDVFINIQTISHGEYEIVKDRMQIWSLGSIPRNEWARYVYENKDYVLSKEKRDRCNSIEDAEELVLAQIEKMGLEKIEWFQLFGGQPMSIERAIDRTYRRGYISYELNDKVYCPDWLQEANSPPEGHMRYEDFIVVPEIRIILRDDIADTLRQKVNEECAAADAVLASLYGNELLESLNAERRKRMNAFDEQFKGEYHKIETAEDQRHDRRFSY